MDFSSDSQQTTRTDITSNPVDNRMVVSDSATGQNGNNNWIDRSTTFNDLSDRSTFFNDMSNRSTNFNDASNRSYSGNTGSFNTTTFTDNSVRDSSVKFTDNSVKTDYGSVGAALSQLGSMSQLALNSQAGSTLGAIDAVKATAAGNISNISAAFDLAKAASANALTTSREVMNFAASAANLPTNSASVKEGERKDQLKMIAITAAGVVMAMYVMKKAK